MEYEDLIEKIYKAMGLVVWEMEVAWDYGVGFSLHHSEVQLLDTIDLCPDANAGELARHIGVTGGAVSQVTKKLLDKGLVESYRMPDNRKEVFFRLTPLGEKVCRGHEKHHEKTDESFQNFISRSSEKDLQVICNFLDTMIQGIENVKESYGISSDLLNRNIKAIRVKGA
ncbi:MAG: MarR family transcriptional regulator [Gracilibacteraceae bacterium]|jgi:DNA-binding MarR family transcriptional regulator|nr:MarR family transcriptional regulator [Gracilibacteraceae bacterium]